MRASGLTCRAGRNSDHGSSGGDTFTGIHALVPCVLKLWVVKISALLKPRTLAETATEYACFIRAALGTCFSAWQYQLRR